VRACVRACRGLCMYVYISEIPGVSHETSPTYVIWLLDRSVMQLYIINHTCPKT